MFKFAIAGALLLGSIASASAARYNYVFGTSSGGSYCDGLQLTTNGVVATGTHTGTGNCTEGDYAGGFVSGIHGEGQVLEITTTDPSVPDYTLVYVVNPKALSWALYAQSTADSLTFSLLNSGPLQKVARNVALGSARSSTYKVGKK